MPEQGADSEKTKNFVPTGVASKTDKDIHYYETKYRNLEGPKFTTLYFLPKQITSLMTKLKEEQSFLSHETETTYVFNSPNCKFLPKNINSPEIANIAIKQLSYLIPDYFVPHSTYFVNNKIDDYQSDIKMKYYGEQFENINLSPDYYDKVNGVATDFKLLLRGANPLSIARTKYRTAKLYKPLGHVRIIFMEMGKDLFSTLKVSINDQTIIFNSLAAIFNQMKWKTRAQSATEELPNFPEALTCLPWDDLIPKDIQDMLDDTNYGSMEDVLGDFFDHMKDMEKFVDYNMLDQTDFMKQVSQMYIDVKHYHPNISWDHLYNRDANRIAYGKKFGHRAVYLCDIPTFNSCEGDIHTANLLPFLDIARRQNQSTMLDFFLFYMKNESIIEEIAEMSKQIAFIHSDFKGSVEDNESEKIMKGNQEDLLKVWLNRRKVKVDEFNKRSSSDGFLLTDTGYILPRESNMHYLKSDVKVKFNKNEKREGEREKEIEENIKTYGKKDEQDCINWQKSPAKFEQQVSDIFSRAPNAILKIPKSGKTYLSNPDLDKSTRQFLDIAGSNLGNIFDADTTRFLYNQMRAYTSLIMNDKRSGQNSGNTEIYKVQRVPDHNLWVLSGVAPNNMTTGFVYTLSVHDSNAVPPDWLQKTQLMKSSIGNIWLTGPFRCNREVIARTEQTFGGFIATCIMYQSMNIDIWNNNMYCSLYLKYTRELAAIADLVYLAYKNVFSFFTIGKFEYVEKFQNLYFKDPRVAYIFHKLFNNYSVMVEYMRVHALQENLPMQFQDPIFGFMHNGVQSFLSITYLKQIFPKNDGFDNAHKSFDFFKKEVSQQEAYEKSPFNHKVWDNRKKLFSKFMDNILPNGPNTHKWNSFSSYPCAIHSTGKSMMSRALRDYPYLSGQDNMSDIKAMDSGSNKRVCVPINQSALDMAIGAGVEKQKSRTPGIVTANLSEQLTVGEIHARDFLIKDAARDEMDPDKIFVGDLYKNLRHESLRLKDVVIYEILNFPKQSIVILCVKEQSGYDKRIFFVQTINKRNLHVLLESAFFKLLKVIPEDMISTPGDIKLKIIERAINEMSSSSNNYVVFTLDQTKFGDEFPLNALMMNYVISKQCGFMTTEEAKLGLFSLYTRRGRLEIMPPDTMKLLNNRSKWNSFVRQNGEDHDLVHYLMSHPNLLFDPRISEIFNDPKFNKSFTSFKELAKLKGLIKDVGFVLGVENAGASFLSSCYVYLLKHLFEKKKLINKVNGHSHSDDAYLALAIRLEKYHDFKNVSISDEIFDGMSFSDAFWECSKVEIDNAKFKIRLIFEDGSYITVGNEYLAKLVSVLSIWLPRMFGQRTSLGKFMFSPQGEVLQAYIINRKVITPLIRYTCSMFAELPGKSPDTDLSALAGRLHSIQNHGGTLEMVSTLMVFMNIFTMYRYGIKDFEDGKNQSGKGSILDDHCSPLTVEQRWIYPTEITGFWCAHPTLIYEQGFKANEIRLQHNAKFNKQLALAIEILSNTDDIWAQKTQAERNNDHIKEVMSESDTIMEINPLESEDLHGAPESRKSFLIHFSRSYRTQRAFYYIFNMVLPYVNIQDTLQRLPPHQRHKPGSVVKDLCREWKIFELLHTDDARHKFMFFLKKYLTATFQESYLRINVSVKLIHKFGWLNRSMSWCFSDKFTTYLNKYGIEMKPSITVREIIQIIVGNVNSSSIVIKGKQLTFERDDTYQSIHGIQIRKLFNSIYNSDFEMIESYKRQYGSWSEKTIDMDYILSWNTIKINTDRQIFSYDFKDLIARMLEKHTDRFKVYREISNSRVYEKKQFYHGDSFFEENVDTLASMLKNVGLSLEEVIDHVVLLERMLSGLKMTRVGRYPVGDNIINNVEQYMRSRRLDWTLIRGSDTRVEITPDIALDVRKQDIFDMSQILKWHLRASKDFDVRDSDELTYKSKVIRVNKFRDQMTFIGKSLHDSHDRVACEILLANILLKLTLSTYAQTEIRFFRYRNPDTKSREFILGFRENAFVMMLTANLKTRPTFEIKTNNPDPTWFIPIARLLAYLFLKSDSKFETERLRSVADSDFSIYSGGKLNVHNPGNKAVYLIQKPKESSSDPLLDELKKKCKASYYDVENDRVMIKMNEVEFGRRMNQSIKYWADDGIEEMIIDNWLTTDSVSTLRFNNVILNPPRSEYESIVASNISDTMLGICSGIASADSTNVPIEQKYFTDMMKIAVVARSEIVTGWNYSELKEICDTLENQLNNNTFMTDHKYILSTKKVETLKMNLTYKTNNDESDEDSDWDEDDDDDSEEEEDNEPLDKFKVIKWLLFNNYQSFIPFILQIPLDILNILFTNHPSLIMKHIDYCLLLKSLSYDNKLRLKKKFKKFPKITNTIRQEKRQQMLITKFVNGKRIKFDVPFGREKYDNKVKINNIRVIYNVLGANLRRFIDTLNSVHACYRSTFTQFTFDMLAKNLPIDNRQNVLVWISSYFNILIQ